MKVLVGSAQRGPVHRVGEETICKLLYLLYLTGGLVVSMPPPTHPPSPAPKRKKRWLGDRAAEITVCSLTWEGGETSACELFSTTYGGENRQWEAE